MAHKDDIGLMAHLMRRAGFGAGRDELEARVAKGFGHDLPSPFYRMLNKRFVRAEL